MNRPDDVQRLKEQLERLRNSSAGVELMKLENENMFLAQRAEVAEKRLATIREAVEKLVDAARDKGVDLNPPRSTA